jgi:hypothetical protein
MKNDHFFDGGKLIGSFLLAGLLGYAIENFAGLAFGALLGNTLAVFLVVIATGALRLLWMAVERSNVTLALCGKRRRLTVESLFMCAGAFLAVSFLFSWLTWLAAPSSPGMADSQGVESYDDRPSSTERYLQRKAEERRAERRREAHDRTYRIMHDLAPRDSYGNQKRCVWRSNEGRPAIEFCE